MKSIEVLFIDDHPMILEGYKTTLEECDRYKINVHIKTSIDEAYSYILKENKENKFDVIFYDISMPESQNLNMKNGLELAIEINRKTQYPKTVFLTMINEHFQVENIMRELNPDGILIKNDINPNMLEQSLIEIVTSPPSYSHSILSKIKKVFSIKQGIDKIDQSILYYLSKGVVTRDIGEVVCLSLSAVEKRKRRLKELFQVEQKSDFKLVEESKKRGFL